jgi:hypothetical protein
MTAIARIAAGSALGLTVIRNALMRRKDSKEQENETSDDPVINSLIYALIFLCLLEYWLANGVL